MLASWVGQGPTVATLKRPHRAASKRLESGRASSARQRAPGVVSWSWWNEAIWSSWRRRGGSALMLVRGDAVSNQMVGAGLLGALVLLPFRFGSTPTASLAQREAEEVWCQHLPFGLTGYFECLRAEPRQERRLSFDLEFVSVRRPAFELFAGVVHRIDPGATARSDGSGWQSSALSGRTNLRENRQPVYRNHRLVKYVHDVVDQVLLPVHREYAVRAVTIQRDP